MPFDPVKIAVSLTLAFFAMSFYFTMQDMGFVLAIPMSALAVLFVIFLPIAALFTYAKAFAGGTTLSYWSFLKADMAAHLGLTLYVLSTAVIAWKGLDNIGKTLYTAFFLLSLLFYVTATLDVRKLTKDLRIRVQPKAFDILRYVVSVYSVFFIIFFAVILTKGRTTQIDLLLEAYPYIPVLFIGIFAVFYLAFLRYTHRGFEELLEKGRWTTLSYVSSLGVFIAFLLLYDHIKTPSLNLPRFPLFGTVFFGYLLILAIDSYSITTLKVREYKEKKDIIDLLNHIAGHFFRTDLLEEMWLEVIERYKYLDPELERARFYAPARTFDLGMVNEQARITAAAAMLLEMEKAVAEGAQVVSFDDDIPSGIESLLGENTITLPQELLKNFNTERYYPRLLETTINNINGRIKSFVAHGEYGRILKKLIQVDLFFNNLTFKRSGVEIKEGIELSRSEFLRYLKLYIKALEEIFPFNRMLLRESVKSEVDEELNSYGFTLADVLDIVPTGIKELDHALFGGVVKGTSTLFLSEERRAKNDMIFLFANEGLSQWEPVIFATSKRPSKELLKTFQRLSGHTKGLTIIDLYIAMHTENAVHLTVEDGPRTIIPAAIISLKQAIVSAIKKVPKELHKRVVLDVYTDLARYHELHEIHDLIIKQVDGFKRWNCTSIITLAPGLSSEELERHFDNVFYLTDVSTVTIKKLFGGEAKTKTVFIWERYASVEEPGYSLFLDDQ